ncbi:MAG: CAP domain-containing protein, partial [Planctomycetes bacterium]|nr:CAP domain-containing protein [Planctomycetota bacterium]
ALVRLDAALRKVAAKLPLPERFAAALGEPLAAFEDRWRTWLTGLPEGLVQRLQKKDTGLPREQQATLALLNTLREQAFKADSGSVSAQRPVALDAQLGAGCRAHAAYLAQHPEMAARWPDAHEQNPEHADWSADGAWAGGHSVIAPGVKNGEAALCAWMGTFYHRLPLLDPGLLRIGLGQSDDVVVLDSGSMVAFVNEEWHVAWPPGGATNVPVRFVPELPNPVPDEDQSRFGFPITLQTGVRSNESEAEVTMRLLDGLREVPCWYSTPQQPTNAELAPAGTFCLIPKAHLKSGTTYTVVVRFVREQRDLTWTFRT